MKKGIVILLLCLFIFFNILNLLLIYSYLLPGSFTFTGKGLYGAVSLIIGTAGRTIIIQSPQNTTYEFNVGDPLILELNTSSSFAVGSWWYTLWDMRHGDIEAEDIPFSPNTSLSVVRWENKLIVFANDSFGYVYNQTVEFNVTVPNTAPILGYLPNDIYVCEGNYLSYYFNVTDLDEDTLTADIIFKNPFYVFPILKSGRVNYTFEIFSGILSKSRVGFYQENVSVNDNRGHTDFKRVNITIIEKNNRPIMNEIGAQTVWTRGENSTFSKVVGVSDIEDGLQSSGNFKFNLSFSPIPNLFEINSTGQMAYIPLAGDVGAYNVTVCVTDSGLLSPHQNITQFCNQGGGNITVCKNFSLTITNENRRPNITSFYNTNLTLRITNTDSLYFNITKHDPDGGIPDTYWYVDGVKKEYDSGHLTDEFGYNFGCGVAGSHTIKAEITDGLLNYSKQWNITITTIVSCAKGVVGGGGGSGGGAIPQCYEKWACDEWNECQSTKRSFEAEALSIEDYEKMIDECLIHDYDDRFCGFQTRRCRDLNNCSNVIFRRMKPELIISCYFTENPSCSDGITNCHSGGCEVLVDCGGPCSTCPTCSDSLQNQGEGGVDCGGPCPFKCPPESPLISRSKISWFLIISTLLLILIIIFKFVQMERAKKKIKKQKI